MPTLALQRSLLALLLLSFASCILSTPLPNLFGFLDPLRFLDPPSQTSADPELLNSTAFTNNGGLYAAEVAVPLWLFAKDRSWEPCYPESAVKLTDKSPKEKNPGTDAEKTGPAGVDPGDDCTDPGPYKGRYSPGKPFPVYYTSKYCDNHKQWRMTYSVYYVHDGVMSAGHRHDWESATVAWSSDGADLWHRDQLILSQHNGYTVHKWSDIISVDDIDPTLETGLMESHPKVFVGFFKHANFANKDTSRPLMNGLVPDHEYRSDNWAYLPKKADLHPGSEIGDWDTPGGIWNYDRANSDPWNINGGFHKAKDICKMGD